MSKKIAECIKCHENKAIMGRGLCGKCYQKARRGKIEMPPKIGGGGRKPKAPSSGSSAKKRETKGGYFETFGARVDTLVRNIEEKGKEIETLQKQHKEMRLQLLKSRHEILQEIDKKAIEKAIKIKENMDESSQGEKNAVGK